MRRIFFGKDGTLTLLVVNSITESDNDLLGVAKEWELNNIEFCRVC